MSRGRILALVGATATGKTALGEELATRLQAEIVCADSRQVFLELEIGTGKPTAQQLSSSPHHLFDALKLGAHASAGWYARAASETCRAILDRGRVPLLVGGSGLYLRALQQGLSAAPPRSPEIHARLVAEADAEGAEALHRKLARVDAATAARVAPRDRQRIVRALEVYEASGRTLSWWNATPTTPHIEADWRIVEVTLPVPSLDERIVHRTREMFEQGLVEETRALVAAGLEEPLRRLRAVGYDEALDLLAGTIDRAEAEARTNRRTRQLAKRQRTWFRNQIEPAARVEGTDPKAVGKIEAALRR